MASVKIGELLTRIKDVVEIQDDKEYKRVTIRLYHKGICLRDIEIGVNIGTKRQFLVKTGKFIMSRIDARNGAFGIIPNELDGAVVTNDFLSFEVNEDLVNIEYFKLFSQTDNFMQKCIDGSTGTTNRKRLSEELFLGFEIDLPDKVEQDRYVSIYKSLKIKSDIVLTEVKYQKSMCEKIRQSILQEAVQGRLVSQDPNDEPASELLQKIVEEKERLIKEKKLKREKSLPRISNEEKPIKLPNGWEWVRLGDIIYSTDAGKSPQCINEPVDDKQWGVIKTTAIQKGCFLPTKNKVLPKDFIINDSYIIKNGDVLITRAGPKNRVGIVCCVDGITKKLILSDKTVRFKFPHHLISNKYISVALNSLLLRPYIESKMTGMAESQVNITQNDMKWFIVPLPPLKEQIRISDKVDQIMALCDMLEKSIEKSVQDSEKIMKAIFQENFSI